jgi:hypothetical protein
MELVTLKANRQPGSKISNYDSLIWTERFTGVGDFQMVTGDVDRYKEELPEGTLVSLRESTVPMIVEEHLIERKKNSGARLFIKGREFTSILDRRISVQSVTSGLAEWKVVAKIPSDVAHYIITKICVEGILDPKDIFPGSLVQFNTPADYMNTSGPNREFNVPRGKLLNTVLDFLKSEAEADPDTVPPSPAVVPHGIRAVRPARGATAITVQIYTGTDRSAQVRFDATRDQLDDGSYLFSKKALATNAYVLGPTSAFKLHKGDTDLSGMDRRVMLVDATTSGITTADTIKLEGATSLSKANETAKFDGALNPDLSLYTYGVDYNLGDIVTMAGDYGLNTKSRVTEYIRSEDNRGKKSYPTLVSIEEDPLGGSS